MAIGWMYFDHLEKQGVFSGWSKRILDIGAQNIFDIPVDAGVDFLRRYGSSLDDNALRARMEDLSHRAIWPPKKAGLFLNEFLEGTSLDYVGLDICPGPKVQIFDLNFQQLADEQREAYDVVLNFGTTEHIFNQYNCFKIIHEAANPGAYIYHQVPCAGYIDHGYWIYSPRLFVDLAEANDYEVVEMWSTGPQGDVKLLDQLAYAPGVRDATLPGNLVDLWEKTPVVNGLINVLLKKRRSCPFRLGLDITTSAGGPDEFIMDRYFAPQPGGDSKAKRTSLLRLFTAREIGKEFLYRVRRKLVLVKK
ncbi:MAG: methyltransferase domain-containing protein [Gammaproteobacteria bacterium]